MSAVITTYNVRANFEAAAGTTVVEDFADATLIDGLSFATTNGSVTGGSFFDVVDDNPLITTTWTFAPGTTAFGGEWDTALSGAGVGIGVTLNFLSGGVQVLSQEVSDSLSGTFYGFISSIAFDTVILSGGTQGGVQETYTLDNLTLAPVPVPAALPLFAAGLGLIGFAGARRRRNAAAA